MLFLDTQVTLYSLEGHYVQWRWEPQAQDPDAVELEVGRSESPLGPFEQLAVVDPRVTFSWLDDTAPRRPQNQEIYYQLRAVDRSSGAELGLSRAFGQQGPLPLDALEIIRQQRVLLEGVNGHRPTKGIPGLVSVYRKRGYGRACDECVDPLTGRKNISNCRACQGTGRLDGYYRPVDVGMNIMPYTRALQLYNLQRVEDSDTTGVMNNYPAMYPGDIVVEPSERHWRVNRVEVRERYRITVRQLLYMSQIKPDDIVNDVLRHSGHGGLRV